MALQVFGPEDVKALGEAYETAPDATQWFLEHPALVRDLRDGITERYFKYRPYKVVWVTGQPFNSAAEMAEYAERTGELPITTDYNSSDLLGHTVNLQFRYVHDCDHIWEIVHGNGCDFSINGEACAAAKIMHRAPNDIIRAVLFSEVVLQAARFYAYGDFGAQRLVLEHPAIRDGIERLTMAYNIGDDNANTSVVDQRADVGRSAHSPSELRVQSNLFAVGDAEGAVGGDV